MVYFTFSDQIASGQLTKHTIFYNDLYLKKN